MSQAKLLSSRSSFGLTGIDFKKVKTASANGEGFPAYRTVRSSCRFDSNSIKKVLAATPATEAQREFLNIFLQEVVDRCVEGAEVPDQQTDSSRVRTPKLDPTAEELVGDEESDDKPSRPRNLLLVSTDASRLEIRVSPKESMAVGGRVRLCTAGRVGTIGAYDNAKIAPYRVDFDDVTSEWLRASDIEKQDKADPVEVITEVAEKFLTQIGFTEETGLMNSLDYISLAKDCCGSLADDDPLCHPTEAELWCCLENMGDKELASADVGFSLWWTEARQPLKWCAVDTLLPASQDKDTFFEFAMSEKPPMMPMCYSCSFLSADPQEELRRTGRREDIRRTREDEEEAQLKVLQKEQLHGLQGKALAQQQAAFKEEEERRHQKEQARRQKFDEDVDKRLCQESSFDVPTSMRGLQLELPRSPQAALLGLMVFKAMGFAKPNDDVFKSLLDLQQRGAFVGLVFGQRGLSRLFIRFYRTEEHEDQLLAEKLKKEYKKETMEIICSSLQAKHAETIEYAAEACGLTISVGYAG